MTLSNSVHLLLLLPIMMMMMMILLLSSIVSCFLMITSSTRFFHSIRSKLSMCSSLSVLISLKLVGRKKTESEWMRTALVLIVLYPNRLIMICYICALSSVFFLIFFCLMRTMRTRRRSILFSLCMCLPMISSLLLKYSVDFSHTCVPFFSSYSLIERRHSILICLNGRRNLIKIVYLNQSHYLIGLKLIFNNLLFV